MQENIHRYVYSHWGYFAGRNFIDYKQAVSIPFYNANAFPQGVETFILNNLDRGSGEQQRSGNTVKAREIRIKLNLRNVMQTEEFTIMKQINDLSLTPEESDLSRSLREYVVELNNAAVSTGSASQNGEVVGLTEVVDTLKLNTTIGAQTITAANNGGRIKIADTHPDTPTIYQGALSSSEPQSINDTNNNWLYQFDPPQQYRILIVKYFDMVIPALLDEEEDYLNYFLPNPSIKEDINGPRFFQAINPPLHYRSTLGITAINARPLTAPLNDRVYKKTVILYDKIVTFTRQQTTFSFDEVWTLNEATAWSEEDNLPLDNGIICFIYDMPTSFRGNTNGHDIYTWRPSSNTMHIDITSEFYYNQPF